MSKQRKFKKTVDFSNLEDMDKRLNIVCVCAYTSNKTSSFIECMSLGKDKMKDKMEAGGGKVHFR